MVWDILNRIRRKRERYEEDMCMVIVSPFYTRIFLSRVCLQFSFFSPSLLFLPFHLVSIFLACLLVWRPLKESVKHANSHTNMFYTVRMFSFSCSISNSYTGHKEYTTHKHSETEKKKGAVIEKHEKKLKAESALNLNAVGMNDFDVDDIHEFGTNRTRHT